MKDKFNEENESRIASQLSQPACQQRSLAQKENSLQASLNM